MVLLRWVENFRRFGASPSKKTSWTRSLHSGLRSRHLPLACARGAAGRMAVAGPEAGAVGAVCGGGRTGPAGSVHGSGWMRPGEGGVGRGGHARAVGLLRDEGNSGRGKQRKGI